MVRHLGWLEGRGERERERGGWRGERYRQTERVREGGNEGEGK